MQNIKYDKILLEIREKDSGGGGGDVTFATQAEVNAGTVTDKAVAPNTLKTAYYQKTETDNAIETAIETAIGTVNTALDNLNGEEI